MSDQIQNANQLSFETDEESFAYKVKTDKTTPRRKPAKNTDNYKFTKTVIHSRQKSDIKRQTAKSVYKIKSLNISRRIETQKKIHFENQQILKRLQNQFSSYEKSALLNHDHSKILNNISRFHFQAKERSLSRIASKSPKKYLLKTRAARNNKFSERKRTISELRDHNKLDYNSSLKSTFHLDYQDFLNKTILNKRKLNSENKEYNSSSSNINESSKTITRTKSKQEKFNSMLYNYFISNSFQNRKTSDKFKTTLSHSDYKLNEERVVVYRKGKVLDKTNGKGYYLVEFSYDSKDFIIYVSDIDSQDEYIRKLPKTNVK